MTTFASCTCSPIPQEGNELGLEGARHLAGALEKMTGMQTLNLVSHVRVRVRARAGRLLDTGHGPGPGRLEAGQAEGPRCVSRAAGLGRRRLGLGRVCWWKGAWVQLEHLALEASGLTIGLIIYLRLFHIRFEQVLDI